MGGPGGLPEGSWRWAFPSNAVLLGAGKKPPAAPWAALALYHPALQLSQFSDPEHQRRLGGCGVGHESARRKETLAVHGQPSRCQGTPTRKYW